MADATVSLGLDASAFEAGMGRALSSAQGFSGRVGGILSHPYAIAAAAAFGLGKAAVEARKHSDDLHLSVSKLTAGSSGSGLFRDAGDIDKGISSLTDKLEELKAAANPTSLGGFVQKALASDAFFPGQKSTQDIQNTEDQKKVHEAIAASLGAQLQKQQAITQAAQEAFFGSEKEAEMQRSILKYKERIGDIDEKYSGVPGGGEGRNKLQGEAATQNLLELQAIGRRAELQNAEVESEIRLGLLGKEGATTAQQINARLEERLALKKKELLFQMTNEQRDRNSAERIPLEAELDQNLLRQSRRPFAERADEIRSVEKDQRDLTRLRANKGLLNVHRDMSGNVIGGTDPFTSNHINLGEGSGSAFGKSPDAYDFAPQGGNPYLSQLGELSKHMPGPGHMSAGEPSDAFKNSSGSRAANDGSETGNSDVVSAINDLGSKMDALNDKWR